MISDFKFLLKRFFAYFVDILIIFFIYSLISFIPFINLHGDKYEYLNDEYNNVIKEFNNVNTTFDKAYDDKIIDEEEYNELISFETYKDLFTEIEIDKEITEDDFKNISNSLYNKALNLSKKDAYLITKESILSPIIMIFIMIIYYGVGQYYLGGQTIGKKIVRLKVVSNSDKKINILSFILRVVILENIIFNIVDIVTILTLDYNNYYNISNMISTATSLVEMAIIFMIVSRQDGRGLHDFIAGTKVIALEKKEKKKKKNIDAIDAEYDEKTLE